MHLPAQFEYALFPGALAPFAHVPTSVFLFQVFHAPSVGGQVLHALALFLHALFPAAPSLPCPCVLKEKGKLGYVCLTLDIIKSKQCHPKISFFPLQKQINST